MAGPGVPQGNPPPTLSTYLRTLAPALGERRLFRDVRTFCLFVGVNRSGSSLVGSLVNAHRNALIAHELNALHFVRRRFTRAQLFYLLRAQDRAFEQAGRQWYGYDYRIENQWQGRCERLLVIGDKHAGGATHLLGRRPELVQQLAARVQASVKMIHVVRHPLDNIATIHRRQNLSLEAATTYYFDHAATNARLVRKYGPDVLTIALEDVIAEPQPHLARACAFLDLDAPPNYLACCADAVFAEPRQSRHSVEWPAELVADVQRRSAGVSFLSRYTGECDSARRAAA